MMLAATVASSRGAGAPAPPRAAVRKAEAISSWHADKATGPMTPHRHDDEQRRGSQQEPAQGHLDGRKPPQRELDPQEAGAPDRGQKRQPGRG